MAPLCWWCPDSASEDEDYISHSSNGWVCCRGGGSGKVSPRCTQRQQRLEFNMSGLHSILTLIVNGYRYLWERNNLRSQICKKKNNKKLISFLCHLITLNFAYNFFSCPFNFPFLYLPCTSSVTNLLLLSFLSSSYYYFLYEFSVS